MESHRPVDYSKATTTFGDIPNVHIVADDLIIAGRDKREHNEALAQVMKRAKASKSSSTRDKLHATHNQRRRTTTRPGKGTSDIQHAETDRPEILRIIHEGDQGEERCKERARRVMYWRICPEALRLR